MTRAQQAFYLENNSFSDDMKSLGLGITTETEHFKYEISSSEDDMTIMTATAVDENLSSFTGAVFVIPNDDGYASTEAIVCQSEKASNQAPATPTVSATGDISCAPGSSEL